MTWYVAQVAPRREYVAESVLKEHGFEVYVPTETHPVRRAKIASSTKRPVLASYLFINLDEPRFYDVRQTGVVRGFLSAGAHEEPHAVPEEWVSQLMDAEMAGVFDYRPQPKNFDKGQVVRVIAGLAEGRIAKILKAKPGKARVTALLLAVGSLAQQRVNIPVEDLEAA